VPAVAASRASKVASAAPMRWAIAILSASGVRRLRSRRRRKRRCRGHIGGAGRRALRKAADMTTAERAQATGLFSGVRVVRKAALAQPIRAAKWPLPGPQGVRKLLSYARTGPMRSLIL